LIELVAKEHVLPAGSPNSVRARALILAAIIGRFHGRKNAA
jgi:hypothetical protein